MLSAEIISALILEIVSLNLKRVNLWLTAPKGTK